MLPELHCAFEFHERCEYNKSCILIFILLYGKSMATCVPKAGIQIGYDIVLHH